MAFTVTARVQVTPSTDSTTSPLVTGTFTPSANSLLFAVGPGGSHNDARDGSRTVSGGGLTYTAMSAPADNACPGWDGQYAWRIIARAWTAPVGGSPSSMSCSFATSNISINPSAVVADITGHDTASPVVQSTHYAYETSGGASSSVSMSVTLSTAPTVGNLLVVWCVAGADNGGGFTQPYAGSGNTFTAVYNQNGNWYQTYLGYRVVQSGDSSTITIDDVGETVGNSLIGVVEIAAESGGPTTHTADASTSDADTGTAAATRAAVGGVAAADSDTGSAAAVRAAAATATADDVDATVVGGTRTTLGGADAPDVDAVTAGATVAKVVDIPDGDFADSFNYSAGDLHVVSSDWNAQGGAQETYRELVPWNATGSGAIEAERSLNEAPWTAYSSAALINRAFGDDQWMEVDFQVPATINESWAIEICLRFRDDATTGYLASIYNWLDATLGYGGVAIGYFPSEGEWSDVIAWEEVADEPEPFDFTPGQTYTFRAEINGSTITAWLDGVQMAQWTDDGTVPGGQFASGRMGLIGYSETYTDWTSGFDSPPIVDVRAGSLGIVDVDDAGPTAVLTGVATSAPVDVDDVAAVVETTGSSTVTATDVDTVTVGAFTAATTGVTQVDVDTVTASAAVTRPTSATVTDVDAVTAAATRAQPATVTSSDADAATAVATRAQPVSAVSTDADTITATPGGGATGGATPGDVDSVTAEGVAVRPAAAATTDVGTVTATAEVTRPVDAAPTDTDTVTATADATTPGGGATGNMTTLHYAAVGAGTLDSTVTFSRAAEAGELLVALSYGGVTMTTPTGWTLEDSYVNNVGGYIWTKTAVGGETGFTTTKNAAGAWESFHAVYAFPAGSTLVTDGLGTSIQGPIASTGTLTETRTAWGGAGPCSVLLMPFLDAEQTVSSDMTLDSTLGWIGDKTLIGGSFGGYAARVALMENYEDGDTLTATFSNASFLSWYTPYVTVEHSPAGVTGTAFGDYDIAAYTPTSGTDGSDVSLGTAFQVDGAGTIQRLRYWKHWAGDQSVVTMFLLNKDTGTILGSKTVDWGTETGWVHVDLDTPVSVDKNTNYLVGISLPAADHFTVIGSFFQPRHEGSLWMRWGEYVYTSTQAPTTGWTRQDNGAFYGPDVEFTATPTDPTATADDVDTVTAAATVAYSVDITITDVDAVTASTPVSNPIPAENALPGVASPTAGFDLAGTGNGEVGYLGFSRSYSVNAGDTIDFAVDGVNAAEIGVYRIGHYGGDGKRLVTTLTNTGTAQSGGTTVADSNGGTTMAAWSTTASWAVPADTVSGMFVAAVRNSSGTAYAWIPFVVRNDNRDADIVVMTSDSTWAAAYNYFGDQGSEKTGKSVYGSGGPLGDITTRCHFVSYDRPIVTRPPTPGGNVVNHWDAQELALIDWLEENGYNVKYIGSYDLDQQNTTDVIGNAEVFISVGHDEYWSQGMRDNVEAFRDAGGHVIFMAGNHIFWRIRWAPDGRGFWCYKDTMPGPGAHVAGDPLDPVSWTGTWKDTRRPDPPGPEHEYTTTGDSFRMNGINNLTMTVDAATYGSSPFWRDTTVATGTNLVVAEVIGFEANQYMPPDSGAVRLAQTTHNIDGSVAGPNGQSYNGAGDLDWSPVMFYATAASGVTVGFGTTQWQWGLSNRHERGSGTVANVQMRQATTNLLYDLGATAGTLQVDLTEPTPVSLASYGVTYTGTDPQAPVPGQDGSIWYPATISTASAPTDPTAYSLATRFTSASDGTIQRIWYWKESAQDIASTTVYLSDFTNGTILGQTTVDWGTETGWVFADLPSPVSITGDGATVYGACLVVPAAFNYTYEAGAFGSGSVVNGSLTALGGSWVGGSTPTAGAGWNTVITSYYVDVAFVTASTEVGATPGDVDSVTAEGVAVRPAAAATTDVDTVTATAGVIRPVAATTTDVDTVTAAADATGASEAAASVGDTDTVTAATVATAVAAAEPVTDLDSVLAAVAGDALAAAAASDVDTVTVVVARVQTTSATGQVDVDTVTVVADTGNVADVAATDADTVTAVVDVVPNASTTLGDVDTVTAAADVTRFAIATIADVDTSSPAAVASRVGAATVADVDTASATSTVRGPITVGRIHGRAADTASITPRTVGQGTITGRTP